MEVAMATEDLIRTRKRADINQGELATELGISLRAVQYFEAGEMPLPRARSIADYLDGIAAIKARRAAQAEGQQQA